MVGNIRLSFCIDSYLNLYDASFFLVNSYLSSTWSLSMMLDNRNHGWLTAAAYVYCYHPCSLNHSHRTTAADLRQYPTNNNLSTRPLATQIMQSSNMEAGVRGTNGKPRVIHRGMVPSHCLATGSYTVYPWLPCRCGAPTEPTALQGYQSSDPTDHRCLGKSSRRVLVDQVPRQAVQHILSVQLSVESTGNASEIHIFGSRVWFDFHWWKLTRLIIERKCSSFERFPMVFLEFCHGFPMVCQDHRSPKCGTKWQWKPPLAASQWRICRQEVDEPKFGRWSEPIPTVYYKVGPQPLLSWFICLT